MEPHDYLQINKQAWAQMVQTQDRLTTPANEQDFANPLRSVDAMGWLGKSIVGKQVLCLAAGGGRQAPLYAAAGARVTVVDLCPQMLARDHEVCRQRNLSIQALEGSMEDLSFLADGIFDVVIHPVSTCYIPDIRPVYREVARVLGDHGIYISQHKQPSSLQAGLKTTEGRYGIDLCYYRHDPLPPVSKANLVREVGAIEYLHRWESLLGEMCRAGMVIEDLAEPFHADPQANVDSFEHRSCYIAPYVRVKARRLPRAENDDTRCCSIWLPP